MLTNNELTLPKTKYTENGENTLLLVGKEIDGDVDRVVGVVFHCDLVVDGIA